MQFVDTHCHIQSAGSDGGERTTSSLWAKSPDLLPGAIIDEAKKAGVSRLVCVGCDVNDSQLAVDFVRGHDNCWASVGIHPHEAKRYAQFLASGKRTDSGNSILEDFEGLIAEPKVIAIGECGLDYFYNHSPKQDQQNILRYQIELALKYNLPMIFHVREAFDDFWPIFDSYKGIRGVLHSFTDSIENMEKAVQKGLYIGVNGIATFSKSVEQLETYKAIPINKLLLETDAPFLAPVPHRGKTNQPSLIPDIANFLANQRKEDIVELAEHATTNSLKLFKGIS